MKSIKALLSMAAILMLQACATTSSVIEVDSTPASDENLQQWYNEAIPLVGNRLNTDLSAVPMVIFDKGEMYLHHQKHLEKTFNKDFSAKIRKGIIKHHVESSLQRVIALYDEDKKRIVIDRANMVDHVSRLTSSGHTTEQAAQTVLLHELVHAADDLNYDLNAMRTLSPWKSLERSAVLEGHAQSVTEDICKTEGCAEAFKDDEYYLSHLPALTGTAKLFPDNRGDNVALRYVQGANFMRELYRKENGKELVEQALADAPGDVLSLFKAERFFDASINTSSETLAHLLKSEETKWLSKWTIIEQPTFSQSNFPRDRQRRKEYVSQRHERLLGSAMVSYYQPQQRDLLPITIRLLEARDNQSAEAEADFILNEARRNTSGLVGWRQSLRNIKTWREEIDLDGSLATRRHFSVDIFDPESGTTSWYRVSITNHKNKIAEVSTFKPNVTHTKTLEIAENLLTTKLTTHL